MIAWCPRCRVETVPHEATGCCMFCGVECRTVGTGRLPRVERPVRLAAVPGQRYRRSRAGVGMQWSQARCVAAIQAWAVEHGRAPLLLDCDRDVSLPHSSTLKNRFGSFADAIVAAGFERPVRGNPKLLARRAA